MCTSFCAQIDMTRSIQFFVFIIAAAFLFGCGRSDSNSQNSAKPENLSGPSNSEINGPVEIVTKSGAGMVYLPGSEFMMGSDDGDPQNTAGEPPLTPNGTWSRTRRNNNSFLGSGGGPGGH